MFRRRRADAGQPPGEFPDELAGDGTGGPAPAGPWDAGDDAPGPERIDFGSLRVPAGEGFEVQVSVVDNQPAWVTVVSGESGLQLQAFAAPKTGGLWDEVRAEIAAEVARNGGESSEAEGPFGIELRARIVPAEPVQGGPQRQPVRFLGADGPRWFLRGLITGPAAERADLAEPLEEVFGGVVVVRGDHPAPPRDLLEIRLPDEIMAALAGEQAEPEEGGWPLNPFERGPEITETR
ncbi:MAG TPA: DUF3710 domain-containing protein [Streptosporangiaceae bacterium]